MINVEDIKKELPYSQYRMLTQDDDSVAERAIEKARIWIEAKFAKCGREVDWDLSYVQEALLKRALYELYAFGEQEEKAKDKKEDAEVLLEAVLGDCVSDNEGDKTPYAAVKSPPFDWYGFK
ncbi:hypothetical protein [Desulfurobacterium indicum]|uniref:Phage gp6-like head-tail connector protein n=1 Tax=Desulfurobacterium indicum TaxID=1914305 RepID=A0A1R1MK73_9BACT|nr:hypothetical protein [Desulfurobacterium indicum]OMH40212.1 hypothetical protein BLW93_06280 [Desulfurobacterium indicum]